MILRRAVLMAVLLMSITSTAFCASAIMGRYDPQQTSYTSEKLDPPLALLWEFTGNRYDNNPAAPAVVNGTCYITCGDRVYAVDSETGALKWKYPNDQSLGGMVKGTPAVVDGNIYFGAGDGIVYCLDAATGAFQWAYQARGSIRCPPVVSDGIIYIGADDNCLYAIQAESGETAWRFTARDDIAVGVAVGSGMVIAACMDGNIYGVRAGTGKLRWQQRLSLAPTDTSPIISGNIIVMAVGSQMFGLSVRSGQQRWAVKLPAEAVASPAVDGSDIYVPCKDKKLYAYTAGGRQISLKWTAPADIGATLMSSPTIAGDTLYVTGSRGIVSAYSTADGSLKWRYVAAPSALTTPGQQYTDAASSPVVADGALYVLTDDGVLHKMTPNAPDSAPPDIFNQIPFNGVVMNGSPPIKLSAVFYDVGSGVDFSSVTMYLDDQPVDSEVNTVTAIVSYQTEEVSAGKAQRALKDGVHTIKVTAKDYKGNLLTSQWYFHADSSLPPPKRVTPDAGKKPREPLKKPTPPSMPTTPSSSSGGAEQPPAPPPPPAMPGPGGTNTPASPPGPNYRR